MLLRQQAAQLLIIIYGNILSILLQAHGQIYLLQVVLQLFFRVIVIMQQVGQETLILFQTHQQMILGVFLVPLLDPLTQVPIALNQVPIIFITKRQEVGGLIMDPL